MRYAIETIMIVDGDHLDYESEWFDSPENVTIIK